MTTINLTIGANDCTILSFTTKQKGYGRQSLYVTIGTDTLTHNDVYVCDVFPNVLEHFRSYILREDAFPIHGDEGSYTDSQGNHFYTEEYICDNTIELLNKALKGTVVEIEVEEEDNNDPIEVLQPFIENFIQSARELSDKLQELSDIHIGDFNELMFMDGAPSPKGNDVHEYIDLLISWAESGISKTFKQQQ